MSEDGWRVSIVGQGEVDPREMVAHPLNPKVHPGEQDRVVGASLDRWGWLKRVLVNERTGHVLDGHERVALALRRGEKTVPVDYVDVPEEDEGAVLMTLDASAGLAQVHVAKWQALQRESAVEEPALTALWAQFVAEGQALAQAEAAGVAPGEVDESELPEDQVAAAVARWPVELDEIWACGRHRLWCGDCRQEEGRERLLGGVVPQVVVADPPYGVSIVQTNGYVGGGEAYAIPFGGVKRDTRVRVSGGSRVKAQTGHYPIEEWDGRTSGSIGGAVARRRKDGGPGRAGKVIQVAKYTPVVGDESPEVAREAVAVLLAAYPQAVQVWWGGNYYSEVLPPSSCWLVWDKETTGYFADCELAWTNVPRATRLFRHRWNGMLRESERERRWHPTQKPAALMAWVYEVVGTPAAVVLDPFLGSGPTLIAAEQRGQTVYGCEVSAAYISVVCERWARLTGGVPERVA